MKMLQVAAASARMRKEAMDHVLIAHPTPGIGKTALANLIATELRRPCRVISGRLTFQKARMILSQMKDRDVLFYDEIHRAAEGGKGKAEWMLHWLQDGVLMGPLGPESQPRITVIGATTHAHLLPPALLDRFTLVPMQDYNAEEAGRIAQLMARKILVDLPTLNKAESVAIASAAGSNPRAIRKLLTSLRDLTITRTLPLKAGRYDIPAFLAWQGITPDGLNQEAQRYLEALAVDFEGNAGVKALEERLRLTGGIADIERVLMDKGFVARTRTGRMITQAGMTRYHELAG